MSICVGMSLMYLITQQHIVRIQQLLAISWCYPIPDCRAIGKKGLANITCFYSCRAKEAALLQKPQLPTVTEEGEEDTMNKDRDEDGQTELHKLAAQQGGYKTTHVVYNTGHTKVCHWSIGTYSSMWPWYSIVVLHRSWPHCPSQHGLQPCRSGCQQPHCQRCRWRKWHHRKHWVSW